MRWPLLLLLVAMSRLAFAEPKVAVAPLDDDDGKIAAVVADAVGEHATLTKPARVQGAMKSLGVGMLSAKSVKKLRGKLGVDVVVYGTVEKTGGTKRVSLTFGGANKDEPTLELDAKNLKKLRKELAGKVRKRIETAMEGSDDGNDEDENEVLAKKEEEERAEKQRRDEEEKRKREEEDKKRAEQRKHDDEEKGAEEERRKKKKRGGDDEEQDDRRANKKKRDGDEDEDKKNKKHVADADEDGSSVRKRKDDDDEGASSDEGDERPRKNKRRAKRHVLTQAALWLDGGASVARRTLTYVSTAMMRPPRVGTAAPAGRVEAELYPAAFSSVHGVAAGFGVDAAIGYTFALGIDVPGTNVTAPIKNGYYRAGVRYRFVFGQHSIAAGVGYWRRYYMADRTKLTSPDQLDMPDVDYSAIAPGVTARIAVTPTIAAFADLAAPLVLKSGPIQQPASYGSARIIAFDVRAGAQIGIADRIAVQIAAELTQVGLSFTGQAGSKSATREVSSATDRSLGMSATVGIAY